MRGTTWPPAHHLENGSRRIVPHLGSWVFYAGFTVVEKTASEQSLGPWGIPGFKNHCVTALLRGLEQVLNPSMDPKLGVPQQNYPRPWDPSGLYSSSCLPSFHLRPPRGWPMIPLLR